MKPLESKENNAIVCLLQASIPSERNTLKQEQARKKQKRKTIFLHYTLNLLFIFKNFFKFSIGVN